jgi:hypothetical protein
MLTLAQLQASLQELLRVTPDKPDGKVGSSNANEN